MAKLNSNGLDKAILGWIKCVNIADGQFSEEFTVTLDATGGRLTAIFPSSSIDIGRGTIRVSVVGEKEDLFLVDLPTYTFTTGSKVWFPKGAVLLEGSKV